MHRSCCKLPLQTKLCLPKQKLVKMDVDSEFNGAVNCVYSKKPLSLFWGFAPHKNITVLVDQAYNRDHSWGLKCLVKSIM